MTDPSWTHRTAADPGAADAGLRPMGWVEAQAWCNFVLLRPDELPAGLSVTTAGVRPEAPPGRAKDDATPRPDWTESNRSCHRAEAAGGGRRLRVKQFLYDFAPPAFDHPSLWRSRPRAFPFGGHVGWVGADFRGRPAAAVCLDRTTAEVAVLEGEFTQTELEAVCRGMTPAVSAVRDRILATPLADLAYQVRHAEPVVHVPVGYWRHHRDRLPDRVTVVRASAAPPGLPGTCVAPRPDSGYRLDSLFVYGDPVSPAEVDSAYAHTDDPGRTLRVLVSPAGVPGGVPYPPVPDEQPCETEVLSVGRREVRYAYLDGRYGPHEAVWQAGGLNVMVLAKPTPRTDRAWFIRLLAGMV